VPNRIDLPDRPEVVRAPARLGRLLPGVMLCAAVTLVAVGLQAVEEASLGHPYIEAIVIAILLGTQTCDACGVDTSRSDAGQYQHNCDQPSFGRDWRQST